MFNVLPLSYFLQVVLVQDIFWMNPRPSFLPQSIPREFADRLFTFHDNPFLWFAGQFLSFLMRPNEKVKKYISDKKKSMGITKPYVGYALYFAVPRLTFISCTCIKFYCSFHKFDT